MHIMTLPLSFRATSLPAFRFLKQASQSRRAEWGFFEASFESKFVNHINCWEVGKPIGSRTSAGEGSFFARERRGVSSGSLPATL